MDLPEVLNDEQLKALEDKSADEIMAWAAQNLPNYQEIMQDLLLDIAQSIAST